MTRTLTWLLAAALLAACTPSDDNDEASATEQGEASQVQDDTSEAASEPDETVDAAQPPPSVDLPPKCEEQPGRTITLLDDIEIPEVTIPAVDVDDTVLDNGEIVDGFTIPEQTIEAHTVPGGCIIEYDAPGGCLGRVEISSVTIPEVELPEVTIPGVELPDGSSVDAVHAGPVVADAATTDKVTTGQVCQPEVEEVRDQTVRRPSVRRPAIRRPAVRRPSARRPSARRPSVCGSGGCVHPVVVDPVLVDPVLVDPVLVDPEVIEAEVVGPNVDRYDFDEHSSFVAPADVLFDFDDATLRPDAHQTLQDIADELAASDGAVLVEGHTDSQGDAEYNLGLSERRAESVAAWLAENTDIGPDDIETIGHGETEPAATNDTEEGRQHNRRVVITTR